MALKSTSSCKNLFKKYKNFPSSHPLHPQNQIIIKFQNRISCSSKICAFLFQFLSQNIFFPHLIISTSSSYITDTRKFSIEKSIKKVHLNFSELRGRIMIIMWKLLYYLLEAIFVRFLFSFVCLLVHLRGSKSNEN